ncbi:MAG TPA: PGPGW domain-containing protein [Candidatus Saccharimonadales bacterium]|nr:PGPGW domain-containing protein [Candidatus Saccharimonadales bacterium]
MRKSVRIIRKIVIALIGFPVLIIGLILIPVPGPGGLPLTLLGFLILSLEFDWAKRQADRIKRYFKDAFQQARDKARQRD